MRSQDPILYLIWDFGSEATQPEFPQLRAVDLSHTLANEHRDHLSKKGIKVLIESCSANHLFGALGTLERIAKRKLL